MAYIHKRSFDIIGRDRFGYVPSDDLFYVDDALAETIQILNTRGYATTACCAGEALPAPQLITLYNVRDSRGGVIREADVIAAYLERFPASAVLRAWRCGDTSWHLSVTQAPKEPYISFRDRVIFKRLPKDTILVNQTLRRCTKRKSAGMELCTELAEYHRALLEWACGLPINLIH